jgi:Fe-Mn family superoxide dismutase
MLNRREFIQVGGVGLFATSCGLRTTVKETKEKGGKVMYTAKDYGKLIGMEGFSETLLKNHFTLYQGYVTNTNKVLETLDALAKADKLGTPEAADWAGSSTG